MPMKDNTSLYGIGIIGAAVAGIGAYFLLKNGGDGPPPPPSKYYCPCCDAWFYSPEDLQAHLATIHPNGCGPDDEILRVLNDALDLLEQTLAIKDLITVVEKTAAVTAACYDYSTIYADYELHPSEEALDALNAAGDQIVYHLGALSDAWIADINTAKNTAVANKNALFSAYGEWEALVQLISYLNTFTGNVILLYGNKDYQPEHDGLRVSWYPVGEYPNLSDSSTDQYAIAGFEPIRNNQASSLKISGGFKVTIFNQKDFRLAYTTDHFLILYGGENGLDVPDLDNMGWDLLQNGDGHTDWEDAIDSMIVEPDTAELEGREENMRISELPDLRIVSLSSINSFDSRVRDASLLGLIIAIGAVNIPGFNIDQLTSIQATNETLVDNLREAVEGVNW